MKQHAATLPSDVLPEKQVRPSYSPERNKDTREMEEALLSLREKGDMKHV